MNDAGSGTALTQPAGSPTQTLPFADCEGNMAVPSAFESATSLRVNGLKPSAIAVKLMVAIVKPVP